MKRSYTMYGFSGVVSHNGYELRLQLGHPWINKKLCDIGALNTEYMAGLKIYHYGTIIKVHKAASDTELANDLYALAYCARVDQIEGADSVPCGNIRLPQKPVIVCNKQLHLAADRLFRTVAGLNLQDHPLKDQREVRAAMEELRKALMLFQGKDIEK